MTYQIKNTISGKIVRNAIGGQPVTYETREKAEAAAIRHARSNRAMAAYRLQSRRFNYVVVEG